MKLFNDLDEIYKHGGVINTHGIECSVCGKQYKRQSSFDKHFEQRECFKYTNMFEGTLVEPLLYRMFQDAIHNDGHSTSVPSLSRFRKSPLYTTLSRFWLFCFKNNMSVAQTNHYFDYLMDNAHRKYINYESKKQFTSNIICAGTKEEPLKEYRTKCAKGLCTEEMSRTFYDKNKEQLGEDIAFTLRSLERGDITCDMLFDVINFDDFINKLSFSEQTQLKTFFEKIA